MHQPSSNWPVQTRPDSVVLRVHHPFHPEDPHLRGEMESLPDLCLPLHCGSLLLCSPCFHLPETRLQGGYGQDCGCFLHCDDAPSEPCGLHPEEQGSEESSVETEKLSQYLLKVNNQHRPDMANFYL